MKKLCTVILFFIAGLCAYGQQSRSSESLGEFNSLALSGIMNVELIASDKNSIEVELEGIDPGRLRWSIDNRMVLNVTLRGSGRALARGSATIRIYYIQSSLHSITVSGSDVTINEAIDSQILTLRVDGGGKLSATILSSDLELTVSGNSAVSLIGSATYVSIRASEASRVDARRLEAVSAGVEAVTGGEIFVHSSHRLVANARTRGQIYYRGNPSIIRIAESTLWGLEGSIHNIGE